MWLATLLALTVGQTLERPEPGNEPSPFEASFTFHTEVGAGALALGGKAHLGWVLLTATPSGAGSGPYLSVGLDGTYAQATLARCTPGLCASRGSVTPTVRVGWAWWPDAKRDARSWRWPDHALYAQLAGGVAWENVPSAPLSPGATRAAPCTGVSVGLSSPWFSRAFSGRIIERANDWRFWLIALLPLALLDHLELGLGWSGAALTAAGPRFSVSAGFGF